MNDIKKKKRKSFKMLFVFWQGKVRGVFWDLLIYIFISSSDFNFCNTLSVFLFYLKKNFYILCMLFLLTPCLTHLKRQNSIHHLLSPHFWCFFFFSLVKTWSFPLTFQNFNYEPHFVPGIWRQNFKQWRWRRDLTRKY